MSLPFTPVGAWEFIAALLEGGHPVDEMALDKPPRATGYVIKATGTSNRTIYIKLEIVGPNIHGRSFHYSTK